MVKKNPMTRVKKFSYKRNGKMVHVKGYLRKKK